MTAVLLLGVATTACTGKHHTTGGSRPYAATTATAGATAPAPGGTLPEGGTTAPMPAPDTCHIREENGQPLPDPACTPGALNPAVTQDTIDRTICVTGWTATIRPQVSLTDRMKKQSDASYDLPAGTVGEYDHLVSLELGGAPEDPRNLWVEPGRVPNPKDTVENRLNTAVCGRLVPLAIAQQALASDWTTALATVGITPSGPVCLVSEPSQCSSKTHVSSADPGE